MGRFGCILLISALFVSVAAPASMLRAQEKEGATALGPETNLPIPRFVSLKASRANVRRGPGLTHRIDWIFVSRGMPLEVVAEHGHWRKVRDVDDATGWVHHAMLTGARSGVVVTEQAAVRTKPEGNASMTAIIEAGVTVSIDECLEDWCSVRHKEAAGWVLKPDLWGVRPEDQFD